MKVKPCVKILDLDRNFTMYAITKGIDLALWFTTLVKRLHKYIYVKDRRAETEDSLAG